MEQSIEFNNSQEKPKEIPRKKIDKETKEWTPDLDTELPINGPLDIPNFKAWINWNGFQLNRQTGKGHDGYDFAAYLTKDDRIVLGLPPDTPIRAVTEGKVVRITDFSKYHSEIQLGHNENSEGLLGLLSSYVHVVPAVFQGQIVKKGDVIGNLYADDSDEFKKGLKEDYDSAKRTIKGIDLSKLKNASKKRNPGRLVHLHLRLINDWRVKTGNIFEDEDFFEPEDTLRFRNRAVNPAVLDKSLYSFSAFPQCSTDFKVPELPKAKIKIANFQNVLVDPSTR